MYRNTPDVLFDTDQPVFDCIICSGVSYVSLVHV